MIGDQQQQPAADDAGPIAPVVAPHGERAIPLTARGVAGVQQAECGRVEQRRADLLRGPADQQHVRVLREPCDEQRPR
ncbi:hypothetical protein [Amycolatopsis sp.]|uniref:hypothetical protein n=1 Tax=Amycolatopsis sp. TaxID=37632 RepID=UPI002D7E6647|nr:hypothetical protein [Amycolatopsis sp.]HET6707628.1 hypothetical protein [Amycolatopsis sp.]